MYLIVTKNRYLKIGLLLLVASGSIAIYLNNEGFNWFSKLNGREVHSFHAADGTSKGLAGYCFFVTNSYVYSLFGIIIGALIITSGTVDIEIYGIPNTKNSFYRFFLYILSVL